MSTQLPGSWGAEGDAGASAAIRTVGLSKRYRGRTVVHSVDLDVRQGDRYGFLGPNGSGKTTTVRMLLGLVFPTNGRIAVLGRSVPAKARRVLPGVGALVEGPAFYDGLSGRANLAIFDAAGPGGGRASRRRRIGEALERVGLGGVGRKPVRAYSLGMRGRLGLAAALLRRPELLILDEPTNGLDPRGIAEVRALLTELNESEGTTIFLSSHLLSEIEHLCTRVGVLDAGRLVLQDDMDAIAGATGRVVVRTPDIGSVASVLGGAVRERDGDRAVIEGFEPGEVASRLVRAGVRLEELVAEQRTLESVVLAATGAGSDRVDRLPHAQESHNDPSDGTPAPVLHVKPPGTEPATATEKEGEESATPDTDGGTTSPPPPRRTSDPIRVHLGPETEDPAEPDGVDDTQVKPADAGPETSRGAPDSIRGNPAAGDGEPDAFPGTRTRET